MGMYSVDACSFSYAFQHGIEAVPGDGIAVLREEDVFKCGFRALREVAPDGLRGGFAEVNDSLFSPSMIHSSFSSDFSGPHFQVNVVEGEIAEFGGANSRVQQ